MSPFALAARTALAVSTLLPAAAAHADVGATLSLQSDARERGLSYSGNRPMALAGVAWDGAGGWYAGGLLTHARFDAQRRGAWLQAYGGRVVTLSPGLDGEAGLRVHRFENPSRYDYAEAYAGLLADRWQARLYHAGDYYGSGRRSRYAELNGRWPLAPQWQLLGHAGVLSGQGVYPVRATSHRADLRLAAAWSPGTYDVQLACVAASRGGPSAWADATRRRAVVLSVTAAL